MPRIEKFMGSENTYSSKIEEEIQAQVLGGNIEDVAEAVKDLINQNNDAVRTLADVTEASDKLVKLLNHAADLADVPETPPKKKRSQ